LAGCAELDLADRELGASVAVPLGLKKFPNLGAAESASKWQGAEADPEGEFL
jgi:hypothetical protein